MASVRQLAACIGFTGSFSVVRHFFGYASSPPWRAGPPQIALPQLLSLRTQMQRLKFKRFNLNMVRVGTGTNGLLPLPVDEQNVDCAVQIARDIYARVGIAIGRVERNWVIPLADNTGFDLIADNDEAEEMVDEYDVPNGNIDCFVVQDYGGGTTGYAPSKSDGIVVELQDSDYLETGRTLAHELGHYFGLEHENDKPTNLMCQSNKSVAMPNSVQLNSEQIAKIRDHEEMHNPC